MIQGTSCKVWRQACVGNAERSPSSPNNVDTYSYPLYLLVAIIYRTAALSLGASDLGTAILWCGHLTMQPVK